MPKSKVNDIAAVLAKEYQAKYGTDVMHSIVKCLLHDCIFHALHSQNLLGAIVFRGGTALQRLYNLPRFSEDLDFVCQPLTKDFFFEFDEKFTSSIIKTLNEFNIRNDQIYIKSPKFLDCQKDILNVKKWELRVNLSENNRKRDMVRIEMVQIPSYDKTQMILHPYAPKYMQYPHIMLHVESEKEIMADKIVALCCRPYLKYRDVFDLCFLKDRGVRYDAAMVKKKLQDYQVNMEHVLSKIKTKMHTLMSSHGLRAYYAEMENFLQFDLLGKQNEAWHTRALKNASSELQIWSETFLAELKDSDTMQANDMPCSPS